MTKHSFLRLAFAALALSFLMSGCASFSTSVIKEDSVKEDLPEIDPDAGAVKEVQVKLFYRLTEEAYLVGVTGNITVLSNERVEKAIISELLNGTPPLTNNISSVIPEGTEVVDVTQDGSILYVTLSGEFLTNETVDRAAEESKPYLEKNMISQEEYYRRIATATAETYTVRRLTVCSIVNAITLYNPDVRVQILVDTENTGTGQRVSRSELGFERITGLDSDLMEPMEYNEAAVATPANIADCALTRIMNGELDKAYRLFAETESGGLQKPTYADFETEMSGICTISAYEITDCELDEDEGHASVHVDMTVTDADGTERELKDAVITMKSEGNIYKLGYSAFLALIEG